MHQRQELEQQQVAVECGDFTLKIHQDLKCKFILFCYFAGLSVQFVHSVCTKYAVCLLSLSSMNDKKNRQYFGNFNGEQQCLELQESCTNSFAIPGGGGGGVGGG